MRQHTNLHTYFASLGCVLIWLFIASPSIHACTIFFLTDTNRTLFCNNEDAKATKPKIWFVPGEKHYGCAYVGLITQVSQGGCNTEGLAFDWMVPGYKESWARNPRHKIARGIPHERMLETCATVEEAIAFYRDHWEPVFGYAKMLLADRTGDSAILGAHDGRFQVFRTNHSAGFGYGRAALERMIPLHPEPTLTNAECVLKAARQQGKYATKYSNVFDLNSGDIFLFLPGRVDANTLNLAEELKRGPHRYDMSTIDDQKTKKPKRLSRLMEWIKNIYCPLRYSRPTSFHTSDVGKQPQRVLPNKSPQATRDGRSSSASRFTLVGPACLSSDRWMTKGPL